VTEVRDRDLPSADERESLRELLAFHTYRTVEWLAGSLPEERGRRLFQRAGGLAFDTLSGTRETVLRNQAQVLGRPVTDALVRASAREAFRLYARYWFDTFRIPSWSDERMLAEFHCAGFDNMQRAVAGGRGVVAVLPHLGNWDAAGRFMLLRGIPIVSVAERLRPERLFRLFLDHRRSLGMEIVEAGPAGSVGRQLRAELSRGRVVALVADRDLTGQGVEVEMFGKPRRLPAGPAMLSVASGAPVVVAPVYHREEGWHCQMYPPIVAEDSGDRRADARGLTREIGAAFERAISAAPADWHLFQPGWDP
jgi:phosphatidylinositol dimannoside acyltransferase